MMPGQVPDTLTGLTVTLPGRHARERTNRRARSNIRGRRANTLPDIIPGEKIFRIVPDGTGDKDHDAFGRATMRDWGRRHGYMVKGRGKVPAAVREAFMKVNGIWTVKIVSVMVPGATEFTQFYQLKQGAYLVKLKNGKTEVTDPFYIRRALGDEIFALLWEVK